MMSQPGAPLRIATALVLVAALLALPACRTLGIDDERGEAAGRGAAIGAVVGAIAGATTARSIILGGLIGALAGVAIDEYMRRQQADLEARAEVRTIRLDDELMVIALPPDELFLPASSQLTLEGRQRLARVAAVLQDYPETAVVVRSFAPLTGPHADNLELAARRGEAVRAQLVAEGVAAGRLQAEAFDRDAVELAGVEVDPTGHVDLLVVAHAEA
jgi:outer membrane protein OmpA-like peptidoglycan-associated protein